MWEKRQRVRLICSSERRKEYYQRIFASNGRCHRKRIWAYKDIQDHYPKYVLSMDRFDFSRDGIIHQNVIDFLMER